MLHIRIPNEGLKYEERTVECTHKDSKVAKRTAVLLWTTLGRLRPTAVIRR